MSGIWVVSSVRGREMRGRAAHQTYGFPSGPRTTPGGRGFGVEEAVVPGAAAAALLSVCGSRGSSAILKLVLHVSTG